MEQTINIIYIIVFTSLASVCLKIIWEVFTFYKRKTQIKGFTDYLTILEYHMNKAYDLIHKDRILIYSLDGHKVKDEEFNVISQDFAKLVIKFIGPSLHNDFINFYGSENTFIFNMIEYFNTRYEEDTIRKQTIDEISSDGKDIPEVTNYDQGIGS